MKPTTNVVLAARNVGHPDMTHYLEGTLSECFRSLGEWLQKQQLHGRFHIEVGRRKADVFRALEGSAIAGSDSMAESMAMFDESAFMDDLNKAIETEGNS
jgi:hypothetical protein